jgi:hypothetical protein
MTFTFIVDLTPAHVGRITAGTGLGYSVEGLPERTRFETSVGFGTSISVISQD